MNRDKAKAEMGAWIADYLDDAGNLIHDVLGFVRTTLVTPETAGYLQWETQCNIYKSMIVSAFPPMDPLDKKKVDIKEMTLHMDELAGLQRSAAQRGEGAAHLPRGACSHWLQSNAGRPIAGHSVAALGEELAGCDMLERDEVAWLQRRDVISAHHRSH